MITINNTGIIITNGTFGISCFDKEGKEVIQCKEAIKRAYTKDREALGGKLKSLLKEKNISQRELAKRSGITEASISRYISGERVPKANVYLAMIKVLEEY